MRIDKITVLGAAIIAVAATGIGGAAEGATASHGVKACVTAHGVLRGAGSSGKCPKHTSKVTIAKQGPTGKTGKVGPAGPGAKAVQLNEANKTQTVTWRLASGDTIAATCDGTTPEGTPTIVITPPKDVTTQLFGPGEVTDNAPEAFFDLSYEPPEGGSSMPGYGAGNQFIANETFIGPLTITITPNNSTITESWAHLLITHGTSGFTLDLAYFGQPSSCDLGLQATPST